MKNKYITISIIIFMILVFFLINILLNNKQEYNIGVNYLPNENSIYLDKGELSTFINKLVYPSMIEIKKENNVNILAKEIKISDNTILVTLKTPITKEILDSYLKLNRESFEDNWKYKNIVGCEKYQQYKSDDIEGIKIIDDKTIEFNVINISDLEFLTIPIIFGDVGDYIISEYKENQEIILTNKMHKNKIIRIQLANYNEINDFDLFITGNTDIEIPNNFTRKEIYSYYDVLVLQNFNNNEIKLLEDSLNGSKHQLKDSFLWIDSSSNGVLLAEKLKTLFEENGSKLTIDYADRNYLIKEIENSTKEYMFYYESNYFDKNILNNENTYFINIETKPILYLYKNNVKKIINKYF